MPEMSLKEAIEELKEMRNEWVNQEERSNRLKREVLSLTISKLSLLEQVEKGGAEKKEYICDEVIKGRCSDECCSGCPDFNMGGAKFVEGFNSAIDLCNADIVNKIEKLNIALDNITLLPTQRKAIKEAIIARLTGKKENK